MGSYLGKMMTEIGGLSVVLLDKCTKMCATNVFFPPMTMGTKASVFRNFGHRKAVVKPSNK